MHMTFLEKVCNELSNYMMKLERVTHIGKAKMLAKKCQNVGNFNGSFFMGHGKQDYPSCHIKLALLVFTMG